MVAQLVTTEPHRYTPRILTSLDRIPICRFLQIPPRLLPARALGQVDPQATKRC